MRLRYVMTCSITGITFQDEIPWVWSSCVGPPMYLHLICKHFVWALSPCHPPAISPIFAIPGLFVGKAGHLQSPLWPNLCAAMYQMLGDVARMLCTLTHPTWPVGPPSPWPQWPHGQCLFCAISSSCRFADFKLRTYALPHDKITWNLKMVHVSKRKTTLKMVAFSLQDELQM